MRCFHHHCFLLLRIIIGFLPRLREQVLTAVLELTLTSSPASDMHEHPLRMPRPPTAVVLK